jgi:phage gp45-like
MSVDVTDFYHTYRGIVKDNTGDKGRCRIFVPGVYPNEYVNDPKALPWAEPALSLIGGNYKAVNADPAMDDNTSTQAPLCKGQTGFCGPPHIGADVWVFFEDGNHNKPTYFAAVQGGKGWFSEHPLQHVFKSDNVRIRIDENPESSASTSKFTTYNQNGTHLSQELVKENVPTRVDLEIYGNVNLHIKGNVNLKVEGDMYQEIIGNKHETHIGNHYYKHVGDKHHEHEGYTKIKRNGDLEEFTTGKKIVCQTGQSTEVISESRSTTIGSVDFLAVGNDRNENFGARNQTITGSDEVQINGNRTVKIKGSDSLTVSLTKIISAARDFTVASAKTLFLVGSKRTIFKTPRKYPRKG